MVSGLSLLSATNTASSFGSPDDAFVLGQGKDLKTQKADVPRARFTAAPTLPVSAVRHMNIACT
jgi:hypothetical protein